MNNSNLNTLFCALILYDYNIRMLHWKVKGIDFGTKHALMDDYHSQLNSYTDEVGEMLMMTGNTQLPTFKEITESVENNEERFILVSGKTYYTSEEVVSDAKKILDHLISIYSSVIESGNLPSDIVSVLDEHRYWLRKESAYKLASTLIQ